MARLNAANNAETILTQAVSTNTTSIAVENASLLPDVPFRLSINDEILEVTAKSGNTLTVQRAKEGTTASTHEVGVKVGARFTADMYNKLATTEEVESEINAIPTPTKESLGLGNVKNVEQASKTEHDQLSNTVSTHLADYAQLKSDVEEIEWIAPTLLNGFQEAGNNPVRYGKDATNTVYLKGTIVSETPISSNIQIFNPANGYRPTNSIRLLTVGNTREGGQRSGQTLTYITVNYLAGVHLDESTNGSISRFELDGISYKVV